MDIKPANIFVTGGNRFLLGDFGMAIQVKDLLQNDNVSNLLSVIPILHALCRDGCGISALHIFFTLIFSVSFQKKRWKCIFFKFFFQKCFLKNWIIFFQKKPNLWHFVTISAKRVLTIKILLGMFQKCIARYSSRIQASGPLNYCTDFCTSQATHQGQLELKGGTYPYYPPEYIKRGGEYILPHAGRAPLI